MSRRAPALVVVVVLLTTGCSATAEQPDQPTRNATLSLPNYEQTEVASATETREFYDRTSNWEDPKTRNTTVTGRTYVYRSPSGSETVYVYTTPRNLYVEDDRIRAMTAPELASLAVRPVDRDTTGTATGPTYPASLLGKNVTVQTVQTRNGTTTGHVTRVVRNDAIVVVVVVDADRPTVEDVLGGVRL